MIEKLNTLKDAGGTRLFTARWTITAELTLETAAHFGGHSENAVDMTVLRDARS